MTKRDDQSYPRTLGGVEAVGEEAATSAGEMSLRETVIHFNHAGASPSPSRVIQRVIDHMYLEQRIGGYTAAAAVEKEMDQVYANTAKLIGAEPSEIILVESATVAWTRLFYAMVEHHERKKSGDKVILIGENAYGAQVVAMVKWAEEHDEWTLLVIPSVVHAETVSTGMLDLNILENMLQGKYETSRGFLDPTRIALICITHIPTNSGVANPVQEVGRILRKHDSSAFYLLDACQSVGQQDVNVKDIGCHGLCATGRKYLRGPRGSGFLFVDGATASILLPSHVDHECAPITRVPLTYPENPNVILEYNFQEGAKRFGFYESSAAIKLGFGEAVRYALEDAGGMAVIAKGIEHNALQMQKRLEGISKVVLYYPGTKSGIITFQTDREAELVKEALFAPDRHGNRFDVSVVPATSTPLDSARTKVPNLVRASVSYMTTPQEMELFCERLRAILS
ncbi:Aminotransferase class-V [Fragilaria crotonensis]|nr:Aminotransferase class-V [Fragilaria crotonensis]